MRLTPLVAVVLIASCTPRDRPSQQVIELDGQATYEPREPRVKAPADRLALPFRGSGIPDFGQPGAAMASRSECEDAMRVLSAETQAASDPRAVEAMERICGRRALPAAAARCLGEAVAGEQIRECIEGPRRTLPKAATLRKARASGPFGVPGLVRHEATQAPRQGDPTLDDLRRAASEVELEWPDVPTVSDARRALGLR